MKRNFARGSSAVGVLLVAVALAPTRAAELSFEHRVRAQAAIERVRHSHRSGATRPFEEVVSREVLERRVTLYLKQSAALEQFWNRPVTAEMLDRELTRITRDSRMPRRLAELFAALGDDPLRVQECLARPLLVDRLTRNFFAYDDRFHARQRVEAEALVRDLTDGRVDPFADHPRRRVVELVVAHDLDRQGAARVPGDTAVQPLRLELDRQELEAWQRRLPRRVGEIGRLREGRRGWSVDVLLERGEDRARLARFTVPKLGWDVWWNEVAGRIDERSVDTVADPTVSLPAPTAASSCADNDTWDNRMFGGIPSPRHLHTAVWTGSEMIIWGGSEKGGFLRPTVTGGRYDPATDTWIDTSTIDAPSSRSYHTAVWTGGEMIVWGGADSSDTPLNSGARYDPIADQWTPTSTIGAAAGRRNHTAVWTGTELLVWGGWPGGNPYTNSGGRYVPATDTWSGVATAGSPEGRAFHTAVWTGQEMIVWGGRGELLDILNTGGRYDPAADSWSPTNVSGAPPARRHHSAVWSGDEMIVWGGEFEGTPAQLFGDGGRYDPAADSWNSVTLAGAPVARRWHSAVWTGEEMIVWSGQNANNVATSDGGRYRPTTDSWIPTSASGTPAGRMQHSAVWTGEEMIVWAGLDSFSDLGLKNSGGRYAPLSDGWLPTFDGDVPGGRSGHIAVWTGNEMIVWGGDDGNLQNTGGRYEPSVDGWSPTRTVGAPQARVDHTGVWTGNEMIVWGGCCSGAWDTGGAYDPVADDWAPTSMTGVPAGRSNHTAVWTGDEMIVWGGGGASGGGRYDPVTGTWTATTTLGEPTMRWDHTAVWSGTKMIVWGGHDLVNGGAADSGGRYDPVTDGWSPTSTTGAPVGREQHTAIWTGSEMIVWGGELGDPDDVGPTGGRYDPLADSWVPTSTDGPPTARAEHTSVWTGFVMIVWGGRGGPVQATGGRYLAPDDSWSTTTTQGAPLPRKRHTAVFTGEQMLIWGGELVAGVYPSAGGLYCTAPGLPAPPVPDGTDGTTPVRVDRAGFTDLQVFWDNQCPAQGTTKILYGPLAELASYSLSGAVCGIPSGVAQTLWTAVPNQDLWFVVVKNGGDGAEGSWGQATAGERNGQLASGSCGASVKDLLSECP